MKVKSTNIWKVPENIFILYMNNVSSGWICLWIEVWRRSKCFAM